jgi:hypothetical protein
MADDTNEGVDEEFQHDISHIFGRVVYSVVYCVVVSNHWYTHSIMHTHTHSSTTGTISLKLFSPRVPVYLTLFSSGAEQRLSATACAPDFVLARDRVNMNFMALSGMD